TVALPLLAATIIFATSVAHHQSNLAILTWFGTMGFHGAFTAGQWFGFAVIALILSFGGFLSAQPRARLWSRACLAFLMAVAVSAGWQGFQYQQRSVAIARANQALCPLPNKANPAATNFRAALDARAAADRAATPLQFDVAIDNTVAR